MSARRTLLLVDDEPSIGLTLGALLEDEGWTVIVAESLRAAREGMRSDLDVAILDRNLQDGKGTALVAELRARSPRIRIVVMTGEEGFRADDVDRILCKSSEPEFVLATVAELVADRVVAEV